VMIPSPWVPATLMDPKAVVTYIESHSFVAPGARLYATSA
jgi:hypothetical protein